MDIDMEEARLRFIWRLVFTGQIESALNGALGSGHMGKRTIIDLARDIIDEFEVKDE